MENVILSVDIFFFLISDLRSAKYQSLQDNPIKKTRD